MSRKTRFYNQSLDYHWFFWKKKSLIKLSTEPTGAHLDCAESAVLEEDCLLTQGNTNSVFLPDRTDEWDYEDFMCWFSPNVSPRAPVSCQRRVCVVIQTIPSSSALCWPAPLIQMILPLLLLLASLLQQYGSEAESSHVSKFNPPGVKEQNGEFSVLYMSLF